MTMPSETSVSSASTSLDRREISTPGAPARVEPDRHRLQVAEELDPQVLQRALADPADEVGLHVGRAPVQERRGQEGDDDPASARSGRRGRCPCRSPASASGGGASAAPVASSSETNIRITRAAVRAPAARRARAACARARRSRASGAQIVAARAHSPATLSTGSRLRKTWSGSPLVAISAYSGDSVEQLVVRAAGEHAPVLEHDDVVGQRDRREPVGDHERRAARHHLAQRGLDLALGRRVDRGGRVVEDQDPRVGQEARARSRSAGAGRRDSVSPRSPTRVS